MDDQKKVQAQTLSGINFILGAWLVVSPYIFGYLSTSAKWNQTVFGAIVVVLSVIRYFAPQVEWPSWLNGMAGIWLIIAPFVLNYVKGVSYWNEVVVGILVTLFAFWNMSTHPRSYSAG